LPGAVWLTVCAWCKRLNVRGRWVASEQALAPMEPKRHRKTNLTHGICPACFQTVTRRGDLERIRARRRASEV
jgi:hypothetical protein